MAVPALGTLQELLPGYKLSTLWYRENTVNLTEEKIIAFIRQCGLQATPEMIRFTRTALLAGYNMDTMKTKFKEKPE